MKPPKRERHFPAILVAGLCHAAIAAHGATLSSDAISGDTIDLGGTIPVVATGGAAWVVAAPLDSDGTVAGDGKSEQGGGKPGPKQAATLKPKVETKTAPEAKAGPKVKAAPKDAATRKVRIELNLISIKNGEKVRSGI